MNTQKITIGLVLILIVFGMGYVAMRFLSPSLPATLTEAGDRQYKEDTQYYTITATYPNKTPLALRTEAARGAEEKALETIESTIEGLVQEFKNTINTNLLSQEEKDRFVSEGHKYTLDIGYHAYSSAFFISYEFDIVTDTGGAHPNAFYTTLVFDLEGNTVSLPDLFTSEVYLTRISEEANKQVMGQLTARTGEDTTNTIIAEGLAPREENFLNFVIDGDRLRIFISPYQAAAYAAGSFEVEIPLAQLSGILKEGVQ